jgi:hypothetical protein
MLKQEATERTSLQIDRETSTKLGVIAGSETPPVLKNVELKFLIDRRYEELVRGGKIKA